MVWETLLVQAAANLMQVWASEAKSCELHLLTWGWLDRQYTEAVEPDSLVSWYAAKATR